MILQISRAIASQTRHGKDLPPDGFIPIDLLCHLTVREEYYNAVDWAMFLTIILGNKGGRFQVALTSREDAPIKVMVRARSGHSSGQVDPRSIQKRLELQEASKYWPAVHGTKVEHLAQILSQGLVPGGSRGGRDAVHFLAIPMAEKGAQMSHVRQDSDVFVVLDLSGWIRSQHQAFYSTNGVINIYERVEPHFFLEVRVGVHYRPCF